MGNAGSIAKSNCEEQAGGKFVGSMWPEGGQETISYDELKKACAELEIILKDKLETLLQYSSTPCEWAKWGELFSEDVAVKLAGVASFVGRDILIDKTQKIYSTFDEIKRDYIRDSWLEYTVDKRDDGESFIKVIARHKCLATLEPGTYDVSPDSPLFGIGLAVPPGRYAIPVVEAFLLDPAGQKITQYSSEFNLREATPIAEEPYVPATPGAHLILAVAESNWEKVKQIVTEDSSTIGYVANRRDYQSNATKLRNTASTALHESIRTLVSHLLATPNPIRAKAYAFRFSVVAQANAHHSR